MASSLPSFCSLNKPLYNHKVLIKCPQVRSQSFHDEGKSANIVDANLSVLRERIEELRKKEKRVNTSCRLKNNGWNYQSVYGHKHKTHAILSESMELVVLVSGTLGLVFLTGSLAICLVSFLVHLC